jgi:MFS transporter, DHA2 family, multidrug resistance protein
MAIAFVFVRRQRKLRDPLIDLRLFRVPTFTVSLVTYLLGTLVGFGAYVFIGQYLQLVAGLTPLRAGSWMLPWSGGFIVGSMVSPAIARHVRPAFVLATGLVMSAVGFALLVLLGDIGMSGLVTGLTLMSLGLAPVITLGTDLIVGAVPPEGAGAAAAISETSSELGGSLGIAILGSVGTAIYRRAMAGAALDGLPPQARKIARDTLGGATAAAAQLGDGAASRLLETARAAFTQALHVVVAICAVVSALTAIFVVITLHRVRVTPAAPDGGEAGPGPDVASRGRAPGAPTSLQA